MAKVGEELRRERSRRGLSINDIAQALHIRVEYVEAIEAGNYDLIPGSVYRKGFIRNYANYLNLSGEKVVEQYKDETGDELPFPIRLMRKKKKKDGSEKPIRMVPGDVRRKKAIRREKIIVVLFTIFFILFLLWLFVS